MPEHRHTIAVIDDDGEIIEAMKRLLTMCGYDVEAYQSTDDFMQAARTTRAKCLIVDCHIALHSGIEMIRRLSTDGLTYPTIFLTGSTDENLRKQAIELNCVAFLRKPAATAQLLDAISDAIGRAESSGVKPAG